MWLVFGCSSYPFAVADWVLKSLGMSTTEFNVASKVLIDDLRKRYQAGLFEFGVESPLFLTIPIAAVVNWLALVTGIIQVFKTGRFEELFAQLFIAGFAVINSWPIYEAMVLRSDKGKMPVKAIGVSLVIYSLFSSAF
ncbi:Cellulose synthase [Cynara cardunculus var. scolymus]|uniref:Cellulose synthase n=1 Tax=Cynara cardunculus var. scolymus TaxID=59895 RepID=A0A118JWX4_CYNCS|nr:Cellulose synthase [Cynara cardunculus var. scolymus]